MTAADLVAVAVRWATFVCLAIPLGACGFALAIRRATVASPDEYVAPSRDAARLALFASAALLVLYGARFVLQVASLGDPDTPWRELATMMVAHTTWGTGWMVAVVAILLATGAWWRSAVQSRIGGAAMIATLPLAVVPALSGHAVGDPDVPVLAVALDSLHVLGFGLWLGTLLMIVLLALPRRVGVAPLVRAFSPMALLSAAIIVLSGVAGAWLHLGAVNALWTSNYGRVLLIKLGAVLLVVFAGAYNWKRATPRLAEGGDTGTSALRSSARLELLLGALVLLVTAVLVATALPGE